VITFELSKEEINSMIFLLTKFKDFFRVSTFHKVVNKALSVTAFAQRKFAVDTYFFFVFFLQKYTSTKTKKSLFSDIISHIPKWRHQNCVLFFNVVHVKIY